MRTEAQGGDGDGNSRWMGMRGSDDDDASWRRNQDGRMGWRGLGAHLVGGVGTSETRTGMPSLTKCQLEEDGLALLVTSGYYDVTCGFRPHTADGRDLAST